MLKLLQITYNIGYGDIREIVVITLETKTLFLNQEHQPLETQIIIIYSIISVIICISFFLIIKKTQDNAS